jgi:rhodanese-related sulfurtransferase
VTLADLLETSRSKLVRVDVHQLARLLANDEVLVLDTRTPTDRAAYGCIPGSVHVPRTVLEWRVAMDAPLRLEQVTSHDQHIVVVCNEGFSSSLAAVSLQSLGFVRATDLIGGVMAWVASGLHVTDPVGDEIGVRPDPHVAGIGVSKLCNPVV